MKKSTYLRLTAGWAFWIWVLALAEILAQDFISIPPTAYFLSAVLFLPAIEMLTLFRKQESKPLEQLGTGSIGSDVLFFSHFLLFFKLSVPLSLIDYDPMLPLGILFLTWVLDSGAYFAGRLFGKHPLFPRISPKKTWEGAIGGAVLCVWGWPGFYSYIMPLQAYHWLVIGGLISVFSQFGDLVESMFKRSIDIKDSGSILPGHGGILDRFDGMYFSVPIIWFYLNLVQI